MLLVAMRGDDAAAVDDPSEPGLAHPDGVDKTLQVLQKHRRGEDSGRFAVGARNGVRNDEDDVSGSQ